MPIDPPGPSPSFFLFRRLRIVAVLAPFVGGLTVGLNACEPLESDPSNNFTNNNNASQCPQVLPEATTTCSEPACTATTGTRTVARADLLPTEADRWLVISYAASELFDNQNLTLTYEQSVTGGLTARPGPSKASDRAARRKIRHAALRTAWGDASYEAIFGSARLNRIAAERRIRAAWPTEPLSLAGVTGTAIRDRSTEEVPPGIAFQQTSCSAAAPSCGDSAVCVINEGADDGTCTSALSIKFRPNLAAPAEFDRVAATVRAAGEFGAIVVDDDDSAALSDQDAQELLRRFESRIAPLNHAFFGLPRDRDGNDRDGNGVVLLFVTSRVSEIDADIVGFFQALDLRTEAEAPASNAADILYLQPPGDNIDLDQLSGTIGHEYQHLINYYSKVINNASSQEEAWLDEGLSTFAEDMLGYGVDAFRNVSAYLTSVGDTSLTGFGLINATPSEADSPERRGAAHLLVRYLFEQSGGAEYDPLDPASVVDRGGIAAVRRLVARADTGIEAFSGTGRTFPQWIRDLLTAVAIDGANIPDVSCNTDFTFAAPQIDGFTGFQRGIDLRRSISVPGEATVPLNGPTTLSFESESVPVPLNGGEIRTLDTPQVVRIGLIGPVDEDIELGLRIIPVGR